MLTLSSSAHTHINIVTCPGQCCTPRHSDPPLSASARGKDAPALVGADAMAAAADAVALAVADQIAGAAGRHAVPRVVAAETVVARPAGLADAAVALAPAVLLAAANLIVWGPARRSEVGARWRGIWFWSTGLKQQSLRKWQFSFVRIMGLKQT